MVGRHGLKRAAVVLAASVLATAGAAAIAPPAFAAAPAVGQAFVSGTGVFFYAGSSKANKVVITRFGRTVTVDDKHKIKAGKGCKAVKGDNTKVRCTPAGGKNPTSLYAELADKSDQVTNKTSLGLFVRAGTGHDVITSGGGGDIIEGENGDDTLRSGGGRDAVYGGDGNDKLYGGSHRDRLIGGGGSDSLSGGSGNDILGGENETHGVFPAAAGKDVISGGSGRDEVLYNNHPRAVFVDLDGRRGDDGMPGEGDTVGADVETIFGSAHADTLIGNNAANWFNGLAGDDGIWGRGGNDWLKGNYGADRLYGGAGDDNLIATELPLESERSDVVNGGSNATSSGDRCEVAEVDVVTNCERLVRTDSRA